MAKLAVHITPNTLASFIGVKLSKKVRNTSLCGKAVKLIAESMKEVTCKLCLQAYASQYSDEFVDKQVTDAIKMRIATPIILYKGKIRINEDMLYSLGIFNTTHWRIHITRHLNLVWAYRKICGIIYSSKDYWEVCDKPYNEYTGYRYSTAKIKAAHKLFHEKISLKQPCIICGSIKNESNKYLCVVDDAGESEELFFGGYSLPCIFKGPIWGYHSRISMWKSYMCRKSL